MPIYAFACAACGYQFDRLQKLSDADPQVCPNCGVAGQIRRQVTAPSFRLAGSGWYETDFKRSGEKKSNLAGESGTETKTQGQGDRGDSAGSQSATGAGKAAAPARTDAKPAAKPDAAPAAPAARPTAGPATKPD